MCGDSLTNDVSILTHTSGVVKPSSEMAESVRLVQGAMGATAKVQVLVRTPNRERESKTSL